MTESAVAPPASPAVRAGFGARILGFFGRNGLLVAFLVLVATMTALSDRFLTVSNVRLMLLQASITAIIAVPSAILLLAGHVDFSIGSTLGLAAVVGGVLMDKNGVHPLLASAAVLATATAVGIVNGGLSTYLRFSPIIVTLGMFTAIRGLAFVVSRGENSNDFGDTFALLGRGRIRVLEIPVPVVIAAAVFVAGGLFLYKTVPGRHAQAIGVNPVASYLSGIKVNRVAFLLYVATSLAAGLGALVSMSRLDSATPNTGLGLEIQVLTAVLLGGVAFGGGRGSLFGVLIGVLFLQALGNGLLQIGVSPFWTRVTDGAALVAAAALDVGTTRLQNRRQATGDREPTKASLAVGTKI